MLEADLTGDSYNDSKVEQSPAKVEKKDVVAEVSATLSADVVAEDDTSDEADDILAQIRNRRKNKES